MVLPVARWLAVWFVLSREVARDLAGDADLYEPPYTLRLGPSRAHRAQ